MKNRICISVPIRNVGLSYDGQIDEIYSALEKMRREIELVLVEFEERIEKIESR